MKALISVIFLLLILVVSCAPKSDPDARQFIQNVLDWDDIIDKEEAIYDFADFMAVDDTVWSESKDCYYVKSAGGPVTRIVRY